MCMLPDCPEKGKVLGNTTQAWKHHYVIHAPHLLNRVQCQYCEKRFTFEARLNTHIKTVHTKEYNHRHTVACKICGKMVSSDYVKHHEWSHLGEKPFECTKCEYRCNNQRRLEVHMIKHETERTEV